MSRLPTISTPSRLPGPSNSHTTPSVRRPRSSLGPSRGQQHDSRDGDAAMDLALQEALRNRPPSSMKKQDHLSNDDPDTPTGGLAPPSSSRTPALRARTPSALGHGHQPSTPASRAVSRGSGRPSIGTATPTAYRRTSMASSTTSSTPYGRRPESRATGHGDGWTPVIGERVRMQAMGMEGTLRYMGDTEFKAGIWAGVELEGGFAGKGKNDGSVNDVPYFSCPPLCGVFVLAAKLSPPTSGVSRPVSVASSQRSAASSHLSYPNGNGRATPSFDRLRPSTTTPSRITTRAVSSSIRGRVSDDSRPVKTLLGNSSSSNAAMAESKITAGSRASKYLGMTAKQLKNTRNNNLSASVKGAATPRPSRVSMGGPTPARARLSLGNSMATPRPRAPRASNAADMMPPPPSPGKVARLTQTQQSEFEAEIRELRDRNAELEEQVRSRETSKSPQQSDPPDETLQEELQQLRRDLEASHADAADASRLSEELQQAHDTLQGTIAEKERQLAELQREMKVAAERAQGELDAGMEAKHAEVAKMKERAEIAEQDGAEMRALVEELTQAGQATISLYENKQYDLEDKIRSMEEKSRLLEDRLAKAREEQSAGPSKEAMSAAEIDNETLNAQVKHFQTRVSNLEEELEEVRGQAEADAESWKARLTKAKTNEKTLMDKEREAREEVKKLTKTMSGAKTRIEEMENALKESRNLLEGSRAEVETLRGEASEAANLRTALQAASATEKTLQEREADIAEMREKLEYAKASAGQIEELQAKIVSLEKQLAAAPSPKNLIESTSPRPPRARLSTGSSDEDEKRLRGFQHIISDLSTENAELKEKYQSVLEEVELLKEENKLLEETKELAVSPGGGDTKELSETKAALQAHAQTIKELNREMAELESLIESKIYREDELESRLSELEREVQRYRAVNNARGSGSPVPSHSRTSSTVESVSALSTRGEDRCELCEGPHDLDACPVFAGNMMGEEGKKQANGSKEKSGMWCADCESTAHNTAECPMAEDVF